MLVHRGRSTEWLGEREQQQQRQHVCCLFHGVMKWDGSSGGNLLPGYKTEAARGKKW